MRSREMRASRHRSADFLFAVSRISNPQSLTEFHARIHSRFAGWRSAIQQVGNLRYLEPSRLRSSRLCGCFLVWKARRKHLLPPTLLFHLRRIQRGTSARSLFPNAVARNKSACSFSMRPNCRSTGTPMRRPANSFTGRNSLMYCSTCA